MQKFIQIRPKKQKKIIRASEKNDFFGKSDIDYRCLILYNFFIMLDIHTTLYNFMRDYRLKDDDSVAVVRGGRKMRFAKFFKEIDRVAGGLYKAGVRKGDVVMLTLPNIEQSVIATYACSRIGATASMIHPKLSADEFEAAVKKLSPKVVFLSDINQTKFFFRCHGAKRVICHFGIYDYLGLPHSRHFEKFDGDGEEIALYMQSGGTSGEPKTVAVSSRCANAMAGNLLQYLDDKFGERNAMLVALPMFHGFGLCVGIHASLCTNMRAVLQPIFNVEKTVKIIDKNRITTIVAVPRMVSKLLACKDFCGDKVSCIEDVYVGGDSVSKELVAAFDERMKEAGGKGVLSAGYGLTETASVCAVSKGDYEAGSVGKPINGVVVRIVDENLKDVAVGQTGELLIGGDQIMSGYAFDKEATEKAMICLDGKTYVRSGDFFKQDADGKLFYMGRKKRLIKISGVNVFPTEIERVAKELDFLKECACIEYKVDGKPYIKLIVEGSLTPSQKQEVISHIDKRMSHWNVPREVECKDAFPRTKIGKIDIEGLKNEFGKDTQSGK